MYQLINKYQKINIDLPKFNYLDHIKKYEKVILDRLKITIGLRKRLDNFYPLLEDFQNQDWSPVLCHHDLSTSNIIRTSEGIKIGLSHQLKFQIALMTRYQNCYIEIVKLN